MNPANPALANFAVLGSAYRDPVALMRQDAMAGGRIVAEFGSGVPTEIAIAAGCRVVAFRPDPERSCEFAGRYLGPGMDFNIRGGLDALLSGQLNMVELAVMTTRYEIDALLYHSAKEVRRRGEGEMLPPLHLYALLGAPAVAAQQYGLQQTRRLAARLHAVTGVLAGNARIAAAVGLMNRIRGLAGQLQTHRLEGRLTGAAAMTILGTGRIIDPETYATPLAELVEQLPNAATENSPRILLVSSGELSQSLLHQAVESAGALVVMEDSAWGSRAFGPPIALDGADAPMSANVCPTSPITTCHSAANTPGPPRLEM